MPTLTELRAMLDAAEKAAAAEAEQTKTAVESGILAVLNTPAVANAAELGYRLTSVYVDGKWSVRFSLPITAVKTRLPETGPRAPKIMRVSNGSTSMKTAEFSTTNKRAYGESLDDVLKRVNATISDVARQWKPVIVKK